MNKTSATGSLVPVLTWSTSPVASSCTASGGWSGTKFASGSETLAKITSSKSYTLKCYWGSGSATVNWVVPTTNTNGTPLTNLSGFRVLFGNSASALNQSVSVSGRTVTSKTITSLAAGTWYFAVRGVTTAGVESANSNVSSKTISAASASKTVNVTITAGTTPAGPNRLQTVERPVYDVVTSGGTRLLGKLVGTIALGKTCDVNYQVGSAFRAVSRSDVTITSTPRSSSIVAKCAWRPN